MAIGLQFAQWSYHKVSDSLPASYRCAFMVRGELSWLPWNFCRGVKKRILEVLIHQVSYLSSLLSLLFPNDLTNVRRMSLFVVLVTCCESDAHQSI